MPSKPNDFQRAMFLALEGLSGTGKTEVAKVIAQTTGGELVNVSIDFAEAKKRMSRAEDVDARMCLFVAALLYTSNKVEDRLRRGITVIVDGYLARTLAYHYGMGAKVSFELGPVIRMPDCSVMLTCEELERKRRVAARARETTIWDDLVLANLERIRTLYERNSFPQVDTTRKSVEQVASEVLAICHAGRTGRIAVDCRESRVRLASVSQGRGASNRTGGERCGIPT